MTDRDYDVIVVGGGIGGLICGCLLARRGLKVTIIEKNPRPGGYVGGFNYAGCYFDAGVQAFSFYNILPAVLAELGVKDRAVFKDSAYRIVSPAFDMALTGVDHICEEFQQAFPELSPRLREFFRHVAVLVDGLRDLMRQPHPYVVHGVERAAVLAGLAGHLPLLAEMGRLRKVYARDFVRHYLGQSKAGTFLGEFGWYKGASAAAWVLMFYAFIHDYRYPVGGMRQFVDLLAGIFQEAGGHLTCGTEVTGITVKSGAVAGVCAGKRQITAGAVIYNGDLKRLVRELVDHQSLPVRWRDRLLKAPVSETNVSVYVAADFQADEMAQVMRASHLIYCPGWKNPDPGDPLYFSNVPVEITFRSPAAIFASATSASPGGVSATGVASPVAGSMLSSAGVGLVLQCVAPFDWQDAWAHYREEEYERLKTKAAEDIIRAAGSVIPGLEKRILFYEAATPRSNERYTFSHHGATGGFSWDWRKNPTGNILGHYRTPVKNLYLVGQWTFLPGGVTAAVLSGKRVADLIARQGGIIGRGRE